MKHFDPSSVISTPSYLELEGVAQKEVLTFSWKKFAGMWQFSRLDMLFPTPGAHLTYSPEGFLSNTLTAWDADYPECCEGRWNDYIRLVVDQCGTWDKRAGVDRRSLIPINMQMVAGVLQLDRKYLLAAFKRLYGVMPKEDTRVTFRQLVMCAHALWNPSWLEVSNSNNWAGYVDAINKQHLKDQRRQAQIADLLTEFDEVK